MSAGCEIFPSKWWGRTLEKKVWAKQENTGQHSCHSSSLLVCVNNRIPFWFDWFFFWENEIRAGTGYIHTVFTNQTTGTWHVWIFFRTHHRHTRSKFSLMILQSLSLRILPTWEGSTDESELWQFVSLDESFFLFFLERRKKDELGKRSFPPHHHKYTIEKIRHGPTID